MISGFPIIQIVVILLLAGLALWAIAQFPLDAIIVRLIRVIIIVVVCVWLIYLLAGMFGGSGSGGHLFK